MIAHINTPCRNMYLAEIIIDQCLHLFPQCVCGIALIESIVRHSHGLLTTPLTFLFRGMDGLFYRDHTYSIGDRALRRAEEQGSSLDLKIIALVISKLYKNTYLNQQNANPQVETEAA